MESMIPATEKNNNIKTQLTLKLDNSLIPATEKTTTSELS